MESGSVVLNLLLFLAYSAPLSSAGNHSLQNIYTAVTPGINFPEFTAVGLVDGQQFMYCDSNRMMMMISKMGCIMTNASDNWETEIGLVKDEHHRLQDDLHNVMKNNNQTEGVHTLQRIYGCDLYDNGTTRGYDKYGYDGEDFISLNLTTGTWTADKYKAEIFINEWDHNGDKAKHWKDFLQNECIDQLQKVLNHGNETLERKVPPTASLFQKNLSSPEVVCHATGFFPKTVMITWQKDGEDVHEHEGVELRETLPNQDGSFQKRSILTAEDLQKHTYTCVIQHSSLEKEIVLNVSERRILNPDKRTDGGSGRGWIGVVAPVLIAFVVGGIVCWKKRNTDSRCSPVSDSEKPSEVRSSSTDGPASGEEVSEHTVIRLDSSQDSNSESMCSSGSRRRCRAARNSSFL